MRARSLNAILGTGREKRANRIPVISATASSLASDDTAEAEVAFQWRDPRRGGIVGGCGLSRVCRVGHSLTSSRRMSLTLCVGRHSTQDVIVADTTNEGRLAPVGQRQR